MIKQKIKYVNIFNDRHGKERVYVRRFPQSKALPINSPIGSTEFLVEYAAAIAEQERLANKPEGVGSYDSVAWLFKKFFASPEFTEYRPQTRIDKHNRAKHILAAQPRGEDRPFGDQDYTLLQRSHMYKFRAFAFEMGATDEVPGYPGRANTWIKDISAVFKWATQFGVAPDHFQNPCAGLGKLKSGPGFHTWTKEQCQQFEDFWPVGTMQRLAYELAVNTGARVSDLYRLGKVHEENNMLTWKPFKGQDGETDYEDDNALEVSIPITPQLRTAIDATPSGNLVYCATEHGSPFLSAKSFSQWFVKHRKNAGLPDECVPHGLRKVAATRLAEAGVGEFMLMSIMGWTNPSQAKVYTEKANRRKMAQIGMGMLKDEEQK